MSAALVIADTSPWLAVFGRFHVVLLHAPLGLLPAIAVLELGAATLRRPVPRGAIVVLAWLGAGLGAAAAASGLVLAGEGNAAGDLLANHQLAGLVLAGLMLAAAIAAGFVYRTPFRLLLAAALAAMVVTGHLGGSITHGRDFLFAPLAPHAPVAAAATDAAPMAAPVSEFERSVQPLLARTCVACHGPDKQKAELRLDSPAGIERGGENGAVVVAGDADASPLLQRCLLPLDDDEHMPPDGKPQPTPDELAALRAWIDAGAKH